VKICFIADANSIHARRWIEYFGKPGNEVHVLSTNYCASPLPGVTIHNLLTKGAGNVSIDGIGLKDDSSAPAAPSSQGLTGRMKRLIPRGMRESGFLQALYLAGWELYRLCRLRRRAKATIRKLRPDIVHCLRLPIEGYLGGLAGYRPLALTTWGNDLVYFARKSRIFRWLTRQALSECDFLLIDNTRDKYLAELYGFSPAKPSYVMPATGGLQLSEFPMYQKDYSARERLGIDPATNVIISIRGFKTFYINTETLVEAIPQIVAEFPNCLFVIDGAYQSSGYFRLKRLAERLRIERYIRFTNRLGRRDLADYLSAADVMASVTLYDGLPISMLEGMAYGLIPVMSIHSPIKEWVTDGWNGFLFDPLDEADIAQAVVKALSQKGDFNIMRERNWALLRERADYHQNMKIAEAMYHRVVNQARKLTPEHGC